jgi:hypothetical protein
MFIQALHIPYSAFFFFGVIFLTAFLGTLGGDEVPMPSFGGDEVLTTSYGGDEVPTTSSEDDESPTFLGNHPFVVFFLGFLFLHIKKVMRTVCFSCAPIKRINFDISWLHGL